MPDTPDLHQPLLLRIANANVNKSLQAQVDFIQRMNPDDWDVLCIQEPYFDQKNKSRASLKWTPVYPRKHELTKARTRSTMLVNQALPSTSWKELNIDSVDVSGIQMTGEYGKV